MRKFFLKPLQRQSTNKIQNSRTRPFFPNHSAIGQTDNQRMSAAQTRYWIGVASKDHVLRGVQGGFSQLCHGKSRPLKRMSGGDWMIYYSPKVKFGAKTLCQEFTAIGLVSDEDVYSVEIGSDDSRKLTSFHRRNIAFFPDAKHVSIRTLLTSLSFIPSGARSWGSVFRYGHLQVPEADFLRIANEMIPGFPPSDDEIQLVKQRLQIVAGKQEILKTDKDVNE